MRERLAPSLAAVACMLLLAACGGRISKQRIMADNALTAGGSRSASSGGSAADLPGTDAVASATPADVAGGDSGVAAGSGGRSTGGAAGAQGGVTRAAGAAGATAAGSPITIGYVGSLSGFGGSTGVPSRDAWVAWSKFVNANGGINGHPVRLLVADDGGNASTALSIARSFVEQEGAVALTISEADSTPLGNYADQHHVPIVGTTLGGDAWHQHAYLFPTFADSIAGVWGAARLAKDAGLNKVGSIYCVESAASCKTSNDQFVAFAKELGLNVVYQDGVSLTAPDYTANCLQARNAGAQLLFIAGDSNTTVRIAQSCHRQAYAPVFAIPTAEDSMAGIPQLEGSFSASQSFPWFLRSGSPAIDEYNRALKQYAPNLLEQGFYSQAWGWTSAKVFQEAIARGSSSLKPSDKITSDTVLSGLWSMKSDDLGGLEPGPSARTFTAKAPTATTFCVIFTKIQGGHWVAPQGPTPICR